MKGSITITNHTDSIVEVQTSKQNSTDVEKYTIPPRDYFVFFTDRFTSLRWDKQNETST